MDTETKASGATSASSPRSAPSSWAAASCTSIRLAGPDGTTALAWYPALHRHHAGHGRRPAAARGGAPGAADLLEGRVFVGHNARFDLGVLRQAFERVGLDWPFCPLSHRHARAQASARLARRRSLAPLADSLGIEVAEVHRGAAGRAPAPRACPLRAVPAAVRERADGRRRSARSLRGRRRARKTEPHGSGSRPTSGPISRRSPTTRASTSSATSAAGRCTWASRSRSARAREPTSARQRAGPSAPRSSTTRRQTRSSARPCSRTG